MKILVTGFEPFGGEKINPALEAVQRLPETIAGAEVVKVQIPVVFGEDVAAVKAAVESCDPDIVLCVGQAGGRTHITPEFVGINYVDARIPDNAGNQPVAEAIVEGAPEAYFTKLPVRAMVARMKGAGIPAAVSYTAGTFCCNEVMYGLLHLIATEHPEIRGGFLHVPYAPEQAVNLSATTPSMTVDMMVKGITLGLEAAVENVEDAGEGSGTEC